MTDTIETPAAPRRTFSDLGLRAEVLAAITDMGFSEPMEVQVVTIPLVRAGRDLVVQSRTGSGKTAAFGLPLVDWIASPEEKVVQGIVLLPTRELALQVAAEMARLAARTGVQVVPIYGGAPMGRQIEQLRAGGQIVCGTPGRVLDHMRRGTLKLDRVKCAVLDECDEMLSMGFQEDIEAILEKTPTARQTLLFSATVPEGIQRLSRRYLRNPEMVKLSADFVGVHEIRHVYYSIPGGNREAELLRVIQFENPERAIVFCNTRDETGRVAQFLRTNGYDAEPISSDLSQSDRERVMARMRANDIRFLVATDVAARGIDLENLPCVINFTIPESAEVYIHRTGRTGRAGKHGTAISLIGPAEVGSFYYIKLLYKIRPEERSLPSEVEIRSRREGEKILQLRAQQAAEPLAEWKSLARRLMGAGDGERLIAGLLMQALGAAAPPKPRPTEAPGPVEVPARVEPPRPEQNGRPHEARERGRDRDRERPTRRPEREPTRPHDASTAKGGDKPGDKKEFWEVWSEEQGRAAVPPGVAPVSPPPPAEVERAWSEEDRPVHAPERIEVPAGQARLYVNLGRKDLATAEEIALLLASEGLTLPPGQIEVMNTHSYINVAASESERLCRALTDKERNGRRIVCEVARPPRRR